MSVTHLDTNGRSSNIAFVHYCDNCKRLAVQFKTNPSKVFVYKDVPIRMFNEFKNASSLGRFYASEIKGQFNVDILDAGDSVCSCKYFSEDEPKKDTKDNFCRECGRKFGEGDNFCGDCGKERK